MEVLSVENHALIASASFVASFYYRSISGSLYGFMTHTPFNPSLERDQGWELLRVP